MSDRRLIAFAIAILALLICAGLVARHMVQRSNEEDCLLSGRRNCVDPDTGR